MKTIESASLPPGTLFEAYAPVERYARLLESLGDEPPAPAERLGAEDAFLLHLVGSMYEQARAIVDLAGAPTRGASTALWASRDRGRRVLVPDPAASPGGLAWPGALLEFLDGNGPGAALDFFPPPPSGAFPAELPGLRAGDRRPLLVCLALAGGEDPGTLLGPVLDAQPSAVVLLLGLGKVGEDPAVEAVSAWTRARGLRLAALRDLSPFLASSRAAAIYPVLDAEMPQILGRIGQLFEGNFDFLGLARRVGTLSLAKEKAEGRASQLQERCVELGRSVQEWQEWQARSRQDQERERATAEELRGHIDRLLGEIYWRNQQLEERDREVEALRMLLERESGRPILKTLALRGGRRALSFGRKHRALVAPSDSRRERTLRALMRLQRRLRGRAA